MRINLRIFPIPHNLLPSISILTGPILIFAGGWLTKEGEDDHSGNDGRLADLLLVQREEVVAAEIAGLRPGHRAHRHRVARRPVHGPCPEEQPGVGL